jgi:AraC-like DNA-binding protein
MATYEKLVYEDEKFPIIFHFDISNKTNRGVIPHWHENIELLFFKKGDAMVIIDNSFITAKPGDIAVVNSNHFHNIVAIDGEINYYCLIIDKEFCREFDFDTEEYFLNSLIYDESAQKIFDEIVAEFDKKDTYYKSAIKSSIISLLTYLYRNYKSDTVGFDYKFQSSQINMVKDSIKFVQTHYQSQISIDDIAKEVGYSKYYLLHNFKKITGYTVISYINFFRCIKAKKLIGQSKGISEVALACGFENQSYFTKTYKKYMGVVPSQERNSAVSI